MRSRIITRKGEHTYIDIFDMDATLNHEDFDDYCLKRDMHPHIPFKEWTEIYDIDLVRHFEIAYRLLMGAEDGDIDYEQLEGEDDE